MLQQQFLSYWCHNERKKAQILLEQGFIPSRSTIRAYFYPEGCDLNHEPRLLPEDASFSIEVITRWPHFTVNLVVDQIKKPPYFHAPFFAALLTVTPLKPQAMVKLAVKHGNIRALLQLKRQEPLLKINTSIIHDYFTPLQQVTLMQADYCYPSWYDQSLLGIEKAQALTGWQQELWATHIMKGRCPQQAPLNELITIVQRDWCLFVARWSFLFRFHDEQGNTPLHWCFKQRPLPFTMIELLLPVFETLTRPNQIGVTVLHLILTYPYSTKAQEKLVLELVAQHHSIEEDEVSTEELSDLE